MPHKKYKSPKWHQSARGRAMQAYTNMTRRCGNKDQNNPTYKDVYLLMTKEEFLTWAIPKYEWFIYNNPNEVPVVARKGDRGHYKLANIEIISQRENGRRQKHEKTNLVPVLCKFCGQIIRRTRWQVNNYRYNY